MLVFMVIGKPIDNRHLLNTCTYQTLGIWHENTKSHRSYTLQSSERDTQQKGAITHTEYVGWASSGKNHVYW